MTLFLFKLLLAVASMSLAIIAIKLFLLPMFQRKNLWYKRHALNIANNNSIHLEEEDPFSVNYTKGLSFVNKSENKKEAELYDLNIQSRPHSKGWDY